MGLKYSSFAIRGIDVSQFNGTIDWVKLASITHNFCGIRMGFGVVADTQAEANWKAAKYKCNRMPYWYLDYYSNHLSGSAVNGMDDAEWGKRQAEKAWSMLKGDMEGILWLDIENGNPAYAPALTQVRTRALKIAKSFLLRSDELSGQRAGIYSSIGWLNWFDTWFNDRLLWCAWYNENQTIESVKKAVAATGWLGKVMIWQYASHGCTNGDGVPQGLNLGTKIPELDLNWFLGSASDYVALFGNPVVVTPEDETPVDQPEEEPIDVTGEFTKYIINTGKLNLRSLPTTSSKVVGSLVTQTPVNIATGITPGIGSVQGWVRLFGQEQYLSLDYLKKIL